MYDLKAFSCRYFHQPAVLEAQHGHSGKKLQLWHMTLRKFSSQLVRLGKNNGMKLRHAASAYLRDPVSSFLAPILSILTI